MTKVLVVLDADNISEQFAPSIFEFLYPYLPAIDKILMASNALGEANALRWLARTKKNPMLQQIPPHTLVETYVCAGAQGADSELMCQMYQWVGTEQNSAPTIIVISNDQDLKAYARALKGKFPSLRAVSVGYAVHEYKTHLKDHEGEPLGVSAPLMVQTLTPNVIKRHQIAWGQLQSTAHPQSTPQSTPQEDAAKDPQESDLLHKMRQSEAKTYYKACWEQLQVARMLPSLYFLPHKERINLLVLLQKLGCSKRHWEGTRAQFGKLIKPLNLTTAQKAALFSHLAHPQDGRNIFVHSSNIFLPEHTA